MPLKRNQISLHGLLPVLACALAAGSLAWVCWLGVQRLPAPNAPKANRGPPVAELTRAPAASPSTLRNDLVTQPLFGLPVAAATPPSALSSPRPALAIASATARYRLFGVITARDPRQARAILGAEDGPQREYRIGDTAPDGARVQAVAARALLLSREGRLEWMQLPESSQQSAPPAVRRRFLPRPVRSARPAPGTPTAQATPAMPAALADASPGRPPG